MEARREYRYTRGEEVANTVSAAAGLVAFLGVSPFVMATALSTAQPRATASAAIFLGSLLVVYSTSTLYHALAPGRAKRVVRVLDHSAIFVLIAGTYTPFALGPLVEAGGVTLAIIQWTIAAIGIAFKLAGGIQYQRLSNLTYLCMGWLGILWIHPLIENVGWQGLLWLVAGGVAYSVGILFYAAKNRTYTHFIWHLFIFAGSSCHTIAVWRYAL
ncbi:MAG TPA: hemolysin III family protein [Terrimicrobiaceae bacterium]